MNQLPSSLSGNGAESPSVSRECTIQTSTSPTVQQANQLMTPKPSVVKRLIELRGGGRNNSSPAALTIPASPLMKRLGYGTGVGVYLLERSPKISGEIRSPWAIKKIDKLKEAKTVYRDRLEHEAKILKQLMHSNIVGFKQYTLNPPVLAMEKASSSLSSLIESRMEGLMDSGSDDGPSTRPFLAKYIEKVALDVAKALDYLHEEKKLIHGDLKSGNVLVFGNFEVAKLCDFGVARKLNAAGTVEGAYVGTEVWNPMEVILEKNGTPKYPITSKADIYPFGLTIYEMISLQVPHLPDDEGTCSDSDSDASFDESAYDERLEELLGTRPPLPDLEFGDSYNKVLEIFYCCTEEDPGNRPTAEDIIALLSLK